MLELNGDDLYGFFLSCMDLLIVMLDILYLKSDIFLNMLVFVSYLIEDYVIEVIIEGCVNCLIEEWMYC